MNERQDYKNKWIKVIQDLKNMQRVEYILKQKLISSVEVFSYINI